MKKPTYEELVECLCGVAVQSCLGSGGSRFETMACSAYEHLETVLIELGILDAQGVVIGEIPLNRAEVVSRIGSFTPPPVSVPVEDLKALVAKWTSIAEGSKRIAEIRRQKGETGLADRLVNVAGAYELCATQLQFEYSPS